MSDLEQRLAAAEARVAELERTNGTLAVRIGEVEDAKLAAEADRDRLREALALVVWAQPGHRVTVHRSTVAMFPIPWEMLTYEAPEKGVAGATVYEVRALAASEGGGRG